MFIKFLFVTFTFSYKILESVTPIFPKVIEPCKNIEPTLLETSIDISEKLSEIGYPVIFSSDNNTGSICNKKKINYGYVIPSKNFTEIYISNKLINYPNTLHNVVLHEILHSFGLHHSDKEGMMNYTVKKTWWGSLINDNNKLWLSIDDLGGLYYLSNIA